MYPRGNQIANQFREFRYEKNPLGVTDTDYSVLKFTAQSARFYSKSENADL